MSDTDRSLAKAVELGAKVLAPVMAIGEVGRIAVIQDPQGAGFGPRSGSAAPNAPAGVRWLHPKFRFGFARMAAAYGVRDERRAHGR